MSIKDLKEFIQLAKDEGVSSLKYQNKDSKFEVTFGGAATPVTYAQPTTTPSQVGSSVETSSTSGYHEIKSPFVGTFYGQSSPGEPPFVKVGDKVGKGSVLCVLEAMKIMNEIESDISGEIVEICVENESLVEFGQTLFKIK